MNEYILRLPVQKITVFTKKVISPEERRITAEDDVADDSCKKKLVSQIMQQSF
jgi:hypothetical protein